MSSPARILHLTLKKKWFDMIASGEKREEYREIKPHWNARLGNKSYDAVLFRNGYNKDSPSMLVELKEITAHGIGRREWGAPWHSVYILRLGRILEGPHTPQREG